MSAYGTFDLSELRRIVAGKWKTEVIDLPELGAVVYVDPNHNIAMGFSGKRAKPDFHYSYRTRERLDESIEDYKAGLLRTIERKAERRAEKSALAQLPNPFNVGDILHYSWGYEQTQCDYFQVVGVKGKSVELLPIGSELVEATSSMSGMYKPVPGSFNASDKPILKRVTRYSENDACVRMDHGHANLWNGRPKYCSWYA